MNSKKWLDRMESQLSQMERYISNGGNNTANFIDFIEEIKFAIDKVRAELY